MNDALFLAWHHLRYHRGRTSLLVLALAIVSFLPLGVNRLVDAGEKALRARAMATPLVAGAEGRPLDVVLAALYYRDPPAESISSADLGMIEADGLGRVLPLSLGFRAGGSPLVGTSVDYFDFRGLEFDAGRPFAVLGECVLGSTVADRIGITAGGKLTTEPENMLDLAGSYPIRMQVVGVLGPSGGPDDDAVFADLRTSWVVAGFGHGHEDLAKAKDPGLILSRENGVIVGSAKVREFVEFDEESILAVHFHSDLAELPLSAAIVVPDDAKSETILLGRSETGIIAAQLLRPISVVEQLLVEVFRVRRILMAVLGIVAIAMAVLVAVVIALSIRIRSQEIETMHLVGCAPGRVGLVLTTEIVLLLAMSVLIALAGSGLLTLAGPLAVRMFTA